MIAGNTPLSKKEMVEEYHHLLARKVIILVAVVAGIMLTIGLLSVSRYDAISLKDTYAIIWNHIMGETYEPGTLDWWADRYIWNRILPRILATILAGASLAVCGALMQSIMNNPLADPYSTGISSGACLGAVAAIVVGASFATGAGEMGIISNAFIGALVPALLIMLIASRIHMTPATLILLGTALSYFFNSMITYMMVTTDADTLKEAYLWQIGHLDSSSINWDSLPIIAGITIPGSAIVMMLSGKLNVMSLGEKSATSLGVDVETFRMLCLALMAVMTSVIVAYTGIIGFVGLVSPHLVRITVGSDNRFVIPISMGVGAWLLLVADYMTTMFSSLPVGVVMSLIGSPVFFILIVWQNKRTGAIY